MGKRIISGMLGIAVLLAGLVLALVQGYLFISTASGHNPLQSAPRTYPSGNIASRLSDSFIFGVLAVVGICIFFIGVRTIKNAVGGMAKTEVDGSRG